MRELPAQNGFGSKLQAPSLRPTADGNPNPAPWRGRSFALRILAKRPAALFPGQCYADCIVFGFLGAFATANGAWYKIRSVAFPRDLASCLKPGHDVQCLIDQFAIEGYPDRSEQ